VPIKEIKSVWFLERLRNGSGSSQAAFCREHGLNGNTFNYWKLRVLKQHSDTKRSRRVVRAKSAASSGEVKFTPVRVVAAAPRSVAPAYALVTRN